MFVWCISWCVQMCYAIKMSWRNLAANPINALPQWFPSGRGTSLPMANACWICVMMWFTICQLFHCGSSLTLSPLCLATSFVSPFCHVRSGRSRLWAVRTIGSCSKGLSYWWEVGETTSTRDLEPESQFQTVITKLDCWLLSHVLRLMYNLSHTLSYHIFVETFYVNVLKYKSV